ncbi:hypothetical protein HY024_00315, partial [Candidatus Curtissbacteria bacterium]|nr:hypothetical protein [Candidatus Curtissbacteria bacterium]
GLKITPPTTAQAAGTTQSIFLGTSTGATANTVDSATIAVGNIASTATNNYSTLNIQNGGTGFLDIELIRGMINYQSMNTFLDDFTGRILDTTSKWTFAVLGTGTCSTTITAAGLNGFLRASTGATIGWGCNLSTQATLSNGFYQRGNNPVFESRVKVTSATIGGVRSMNGFSNASMATTVETLTAGHAWIGKKAADTAWQCVSSDGTTESQTTTGVTIVSGTNYRLRVQVLNGTTPQVICTVDDGTTVTRISKTTNVPLAATAMDIYEKCETTDTTSDTCDYDYVRTWQDDPPLSVVNSQPQESSSEVGLLAGDHSASESAALATNLNDSVPPVPLVLNTNSEGQIVVHGKDGANVITLDNLGNATFTGVVTADKIYANQIEGLEVFANQISSLKDQSEKLQTDFQQRHGRVCGY